jgi:hypothetical protein
MVAQLEKLVQACVSMLGKQDETILVIKEEGGKTRGVVKEEGEKTREVVQEEGKLTRDLMSTEGEKTRGVLKGTLAEDMVWVKDEIIDMKATLNRVKQKVGVE